MSCNEHKFESAIQLGKDIVDPFLLQRSDQINNWKCFWFVSTKEVI
ncbi:unnamed protein product [Brugia timori]|uniref:Uncharacterized protein n=1 Tax=Brugia timori TaxID=42155 RepID=A0A3P7UI58_9BILA|nr:unnamed protein product [Brugia timori]